MVNPKLRDFLFIPIMTMMMMLCVGSMLGCDAFARQTNGKRSHGIPIITARRRSSSSASALKVLPSVVDEGTLWGVRTVSAILSYVGFVGFYDRPRGGDLVDPGAVEIKPSTVPGAGLGLFARHNLPKGTVLGAYPGVLVPLSQNLGKLKKYPECEAYVWRFSDNAFVIDPTNDVGKVDAVCVGGRDGLPGSQWLFRNVFRMSVPTTLCRINEPPLGRDVNVVTEEDRDRRCVAFLLERDVIAGEEFFIDYGLSYDRSMYSKK